MRKKHIIKHKKRKYLHKNKIIKKIFKKTKKENKSDVQKLKRNYVKKIEAEILDTADEDVVTRIENKDSKENKSNMEQILFKVPVVKDPIIGTPKQVQKQLDSLVKKMQKNPGNMDIFNKIHLYMHGYLISVVLKKFPYIKGYQSSDIYQESLISLRFKAIPNFKKHKGMSFLNFAKMCIRRHLITLLNTSRTRKKDQSMNQAVSLDSTPMDIDNENDENRNTYSNIIGDPNPVADEIMERDEAMNVTKNTLYNALSSFERIVLKEYLNSSSYKEIAKNVSAAVRKRCGTKSIDNALLRIRKKAYCLVKITNKLEDVPLFILR